MSLAGAKGVERPSEHRLGVLFEISIVCHVLCSWFWRGGWGFSLFWGLFWLVRRVFSGFWGSLRFSLFCSCLLGWGRVAGVPGFGVWCARAACFLFVGGGSVACFLFVEGGSGVRLRAPEWLASSLLGGAGSGVCASPGSCCVVVGVGLCPVSCSCSRCCCRVRGGFSGVVFSVRCFSCSPGFRCWSSWSCRGSGGCGGCRVGFGVVFSPASVVLARACFRFPSWGAGLGLGWVLFGEFDPGSGRTLAACLTHASRTGPPLCGWVEWRTGEYHVSNLPPAPG